jgi:hypothetical protein
VAHSHLLNVTSSAHSEELEVVDKEAIQKLAKKAVLAFLLDWEDTRWAQMVERDGIYFLVVKLDSPFSAELHINIEERCEQLLTSYYEVFGTEESEDNRADFVRMLVPRLSQELTYIAKTGAPSLLIYSLYLLDFLAHRERLRSVSESFTQDKQERLARLARIITEGLLTVHDLTEKPKTKTSRVINEEKVLDVFLRLRGEVPSIRRLAKELDTEPVNVRNWLRKKGYDSPKELANDLVSTNTKSTMDYLLKVKKVLEQESEKGG